VSRSVTDRPHLSIGEVLGLLLEEFPDVTISKIRFLESQGLIDPERSPSGYRRFYEVDVDRLRMILREQRENFLPLKVIRDRLENGSIEPDPSGPVDAPRGIRNVTPMSSHHPSGQLRLAPIGADPDDDETDSTQDGMPATADGAAGGEAGADDTGEIPPPWSPAGVDQRSSFSVAELCRIAGVTSDQLEEMESFGVITTRSGPAGRYTAADVAVARAAGALMGHGVGGRHLRGWRQAVDRETSLFEQLIVPLLRQRNPHSRQQALNTLDDLSRLGGELRAAMVTAALRPHVTAHSAGT